MAVAVGIIEAQVVAWAPRFGDAVWTDLVAEYSAAAQRFHVESAFSLSDVVGISPSVYVDAMTCYVLHWLVLTELENAGWAGTGGPITALRTGDESVAFQQAGGSSAAVPGDAHYTQTSWGRRYLTYRNSRPASHLFLV